MAQTGSSSFLANMAARRRQLTKTRAALLDRQGTARRGGPPPPTAPKQDRTSPQEQAIDESRLRKRAEIERPRPNEPAEESLETGREAQEGVPRLFDEETREELRSQIRPLIKTLRDRSLAKRHRTIGRTRRLWGSGI